ncbi:ABC transporter ATP-binding protein [Clostridium sp. BJN0001]|uniref:ABC transporter ATP-binding protein n=1 Tax=Clostridium sp. BJN0001 TaxID=2930219 RepID=UPI001FD091BB|nr:ABC transporter ATP-binding protein [Clostridium sp. BJN0001]
MNALDIKNLNKKFKNFSLKDIEIELPKGYILGYVGQNGSGKTTTIKLIMNFLKMDSGIIKVFGKEYSENESEYKNMIGYIADECYFPENLTTKDILKINKGFYKEFDEKKYNSMLSKWKIPKDKKIKDFSKGMKVKLSFASVFSRKTKLLILDEATSGLDPVVRDEILKMIQDYIEDGEKSVIFSSHIESDIEKIADYIYFIDDGKIILNGVKDDILENHMIIKGGSSEMTSEIKEKVIGYEINDVCFRALIKTDDKKYFSNNFLYEKPNVEDIVVLYIKGLNK